MRQRKFFLSTWEQFGGIYSFEIEKAEFGRKLTPEKRALLDEILSQVNDLGGDFGTANRNSRIKRLRYVDIEFRKVIGHGKFGKVFQGYHSSRIVAVKQIIPETMSKQSLMAFVAEIHMMSLLRHNNIVECIGAVLKSPQLCLVTEFAKRGSLKSVLRTSKNLTWMEGKRKSLIDITAGMAYLHGMKNPIAHRDLKSDNCLVYEDMTVKISDFGLARTMRGQWGVRALRRLKRKDTCVERNEGDTERKGDKRRGNKREGGKKLDDDNSGDDDITEELSNVIGTPMYMAPEIILSRNYDERVDIFSFGMLIADVFMDGRVRKLFQDGNGQLSSEVSSAR